MRLKQYSAPIEVRLAALWASATFCYVYGDYIGLYGAGKLAEMGRGMIGPLGPATPGVLLGVAVMMAVPGLMVALSLLLPARACRWASIILGIAYSGIVAATVPGAPPFYIMLSVIEIGLTLAIAVTALHWPRETAHG
jgi:hypothetical protein